ncbi:MAG: 23S rRNA (pseudouridine(1915)-N(3))-methyltransferase RlmH [Gemmatimonadetes bacterium]|nr:23S rRNA (pseudouridine(1915)-N(3))-methyltransferase RlmH [Gemmatimonadota bacterium]
MGGGRVKIEILAVDRLRAEWARLAMADYLGRIRRYVPIERRDVKAGRGGNGRGREEEGKRLLRTAAIGSADRLVALTSEGGGLGSPAWARMAAEWGNDGVGRMVFVVGGAGGLSPKVLADAHRALSLGPQTLSHELAQVVLAEQIYRAWTILRGEPYHKRAAGNRADIPA